jgi:hypothetical protein
MTPRSNASFISSLFGNTNSACKDQDFLSLWHFPLDDLSYYFIRDFYRGSRQS